MASPAHVVDRTLASTLLLLVTAAVVETLRIWQRSCDDMVALVQRLRAALESADVEPVTIDAYVRFTSSSLWAALSLLIRCCMVCIAVSRALLRPPPR